ncbi:MAG TPA: ATP synthase subunit I [Chloroflexota bacterium]|nr:ATP synthase subunit I [Chloroflexota bacterium]
MTDELRRLVMQCVLAGVSCGLILAGLLMLTNHQREALGLLFGVAIGVTNQLMLAVRVDGIGRYGSRGQTQAIMAANTGLRFLMMGLATYLTLRLSATLSLLGFTTGLVLTMAAATAVGARFYLRKE